MTRTFEDVPAVRTKTPLLVGVVGPSGSGKSRSALRLATGIQRVTGGDIHVVDTEARRALHYAPKPGEKADPAKGTFAFRHVPFGAPFSPLDYLEVLEHCYSRGARTIVVDSCSHEHEGPGGVLEMFESEVYRRAGDDWKKAERVKMTCWQKPKAMRRRLINAMLQMECNFILCFRAKPKLKLVTGKDPEQMGWQPIAGSEFVYEMTVKFLLLPGARGTPTMASTFEAEREMIKVPDQFEHMFKQPRQLSEDVGQELALWAAGSNTEPANAAALLRSYAACSDPATWRSLESQRGLAWQKVGADDKQALKKAAADAEARIKAQSEPVQVGGDGEPPPDVKLIGEAG